jgi:formylglycine-generating enzyme required for sulfatase activity
MSFVFISYSHKDRDYARRLADSLAACGIEAWIDDRIDYGSRWPHVIQDQVDRCGAFGVVMTPASFHSDWVQSELAYAVRKGKPIYPLLLEGEIWLSVAARQVVRVTGGVLPEAEFYSSLARVVSSRSTSPDILTITTPIRLELIRIPAGKFLMGSDPARDKDALAREQPQHTIYLPEFYIARTPVTNAQFGAFVQATGYRTYVEKKKYVFFSWRMPKGKSSGIWGKARHPVVYITRNDALAFCRWAGVRLPTEAEWEKAARSTDGRLYPWGDNPPTSKLCNYDQTGVEDTTPVGQFPAGASPYGVMDMAGNVWEYCSSLQESYPFDASDGREDLNSDGPHAVRGGSWRDDRTCVQCACRGWMDPDYGPLRLGGFRVAKGPLN